MKVRVFFRNSECTSAIDLKLGPVLPFDEKKTNLLLFCTLVCKLPQIAIGSISATDSKLSLILPLMKDEN